MRVGRAAMVLCAIQLDAGSSLLRHKALNVDSGPGHPSLVSDAMMFLGYYLRLPEDCSELRVIFECNSNH